MVKSTIDFFMIQTFSDFFLDGRKRRVALKWERYILFVSNKTGGGEQIKYEKNEYTE
jgi:hypothetical protein